MENIHGGDHAVSLTNKRNLLGVTARIFTIIAVAMTLFQIYTAFFGVFESIKQRSIHMLFAIVLSLLLFAPAKKTAGQQKQIGLIDWVLIFVTVISYGYVVINAASIASRLSYVTPLTNIELFLGILAILVTLEVSRRVVGNIFLWILIIALLYGLFGHMLPGDFGHRTFSLMWVIDHLIYTTQGIFGIPASVSATYIFIFVLFGSFLEKTGAGEKFIQVALSAMGGFRGGPAKAAVLGSCLFGMISGSAVANVATVGTLTIPLMKRIGYSPVFAGAVEAVSSSGGQFMPPIMGATAFVIAEFTGVPYAHIAAAAFIPALLYYLAVGWQIHFEAARIGMTGMKREELPNLRKSFNDSLPFFIPIIVIVYMLIIGYSPLKAGLYALISLIIICYLFKSTRLNLKGFIKAMEGGAKGILEVAITCGAAGIVIGVITLTGLGLKLSSIIIALAGGNLLAALILVMITTLILGMGLPTVAAYIVQVALTVPALINMGLNPLTAHLFIFYFAAISNITPPVALAAYAAAGLAGGDQMKTGFVACRMGIVAFFVPFMFVYGPSMILMGTTLEIIGTAISGTIGVISLAAALEGWLITRTTILERILLMVGGFALIKPGLFTDLLGLALFFGVLLLQRLTLKKVKIEPMLPQ